MAAHSGANAKVRGQFSYIRYQVVHYPICDSFPGLSIPKITVLGGILRACSEGETSCQCDKGPNDFISRGTS